MSAAIAIGIALLVFGALAMIWASPCPVCGSSECNCGDDDE